MEETLETKSELALNALLEITQSINSNLPENDLYKIYKFTLIANLKVQKLALYVPDQKSWYCKAYFGTENVPAIVDSFDDLLGRLDRSGILTGCSDAIVKGFTTVFPIHHKDKLLALVLIDSTNGVNITFLKAITNILMVAIENKKFAREKIIQEAYKKELEIARNVQNFLFPKQLPKSSRLRIEAVYLPHRDIGGDYYDYIPLSEDRFIICIADVSGKGVPAALLMSNFQASLRVLVRKTENLKELVRELNYSTSVNGDSEHFITFFMGLYDFKDATFQYVNCGHNPSVIFKNGEVIILDEGTTILGIFDPLPFLESKKIENLTDFTFFGYTDGLTEAFNDQGDQFGFERYLGTLKTNVKQNLKIVHQLVFNELDKFRNETPFGDDITMISCQVSGK